MADAKISKYTIIGEIGRGAMGIVYKALDPYIGRTVAIKTIRFDLLGSGPEKEIAQKRFMREAHSAGNLSHPNIVTIYDVGEDQGLSYIAMEYVDGSSLDELIHAHQPFSLDEILNLIEQVAEGLESAHRKGVVHRDIKPANILIGSDGRPRIVDFGIARISTSTMTQTNMIMGTPYYMSPEQISGRRVDNRADIFALGGILYELLTGQKPFPGDSLTTVIYKIMNEEPTPIRTFQKTVPEGLDYIVHKALAKSPDDRYQTCREMIDDLQHYTQLRMPASAAAPRRELEVPAPPAFRESRRETRREARKETKREAGPTASKRRLKLFVVAGAAVVVLAVVAVLVFSRGSGGAASGSTVPRPAPGNLSLPAAGDPPAALLEAGRRLLGDKKYAEALAVLDSVPESAGEYFEARLMAGSVLEAQDRWGQAASEYRRLIQLNPKDARPYFHMGQVEEQRNDPRAALDDYRHFLQLSPEGVDAEDARWKIKTLESRSLADASTNETPVPKAQTHASTETPSKSGVTPATGKPGDSGTAIPPVKPAAVLSPAERAAQVDRLLEAGQKSFEAKNYAQAVQQLQSALDLDPGNAAVRGLFDRVKKKYEEENRQETIKKELDQARAALRDLNYAEAETQSRRALALDDSLGEAKRIIGTAVVKGAPAEIKVLLDQYLQAIRQSDLGTFYSLQCTPEQYQRIRQDTETMTQSYEGFQVSGTALDVSVREIKFDQYEAEADFSQVMTGLSKAKAAREVVFEGKVRWQLVNSGGGWKISGITASPKNKR